jgi:16S rRNA (uracil1498-N3)-methyltransferase
MRISRVYTNQALAPDQHVSLDGNTANYIARVLRQRAGNPLVVFNGDGFDYAAEITSVGKDKVDLNIHARLPAAGESELNITLVQAISRGERMDYSLQKATELGVSGFQPVISDRVEVKLDEKRLRKRMQHWQGVIISACEQSGRAVVPDLATPLGLGPWMGNKGSAARYLLDPESDQALSQQLFDNNQVELLVGPEGGFTEGELTALARAGVLPVSLGPRVLRTETAGPAAIAILQALAGDC